ncbi:MAG: hypothetical protein EAZ30_06605 [Betaproteobacteria bacterium]|nr:MAG: hypothetical protein EAZ30_06605 [Betaproteobacteria bacterium]
MARPLLLALGRVNRVVSVSPASDPIPAATASITVAQAGASRCTVVSGLANVSAAGGAVSYTATCSNVTAGGYLWKLDGAAIAACTGSSCSVAMPANTSVSPVNRVVSVSPASDPIPAATASLTVAQAGASRCTVVSGVTSVPAAGGAVSYTATCSNVTAGGYLWKLDGASIAACTGSSCSVTMPANTSVSAVDRVVSVSPAANPIPAATASITVAQAAAVACSLDFNGDGAMNASDSLLFTRWLLGFRGDALVSGITPYPAGTTTTAFATAVTSRMVLGLVHDFDNNTKVDAATDGLLLLRLTQGLTGTAVTNGALGVGALRNTHELIRTHVNSSCGTSFAAAPTAAPTPSLSINTDATSLSALGAVYPASTTYSFISGNGGRSAVKFNGVANPGAIRIPNTAAMQFNTGATIDLWARIDSGTGMSGANGLASTSGWAMALVAKSHDGGSVALNALANDSNAAGSGYGFGAWSSSVSGWGTGTCTIVNRNPGAALGTWFRLTAVASTTTGTRIYHNKQLIYSCPSAVPNFTGMNGQDLYIGRYSSVWYPLDGAVQDIRIYQQALTDAQVQALP